VNCPVCQQPMLSLRGSQLDRHKPENERDGYTVYCPNRKCPAQEASAHGTTEKAALATLKERFAFCGL
jgi:hypothetical protein